MKTVKRGLAVVAFLVAVAGVGFYLRPLSYFNGIMYIKAFLSGVESHTVEVSGYRVHYNVHGPKSGAPVVLVHGLAGRAEDWQSLSVYLVASGYRVYMPDLLGCGRSERPRDFSYAVHDEAEQVVRFMDAVGLKQADVGGWSMGGWIVQVVAARHPERVRRLMLFDSSGIHEYPKYDVELFTPHSAEDLDQLDVLLMPKPPQVPQFIARDIIRTSDEDAWVVHKSLNEMLSAQDTTEAMLPQLKMPVLLVWGGEDKITPESQGETIHRLVPQSQLVVIAGCGHLAPDQCADKIGPKVAEFLKR